MHAPGASHHARWMSSMTYTMKITLFRHQLGLVFQEKVLDMIQELAIYLALFYVRYWLTCTSPADAPAIDLKLMLDLEVASKKLPTVLMKNLAVASYKKMTNHLWYLSERLVPLALFSNKVSDLEKANIVKEMKKFDPLEKENQVQKMPSPKKFASKTLKDFVGGNSWVFFARHGNPRPTFLEISVTQWITNIEYLGS